MQSNSPPPASSNSAPGPSSVRRTLMLVATLVVGAVGWVLLDEPDAVGAAESRPIQVVAKVDGHVVTEDDVRDHARQELEQLEAQRAEILRRSLAARVDELLLVAEADARGIDRDTLLRLEVDAKVDPVGSEELSWDERRELRRREFLDELRGRHTVEVVSAHRTGRNSL